MTPQEALNRLIDSREIFHDEMLAVMRQIMGGEMTPAQIAAILIGLRVKKETIGEIAAAAQVMREFATQVPVADRDRLVDTCGTGGDAAHTFNMLRTPSTSPPPPRWWLRRPVRRWRSTAGARCRASRAARTCSRRSACT